MKLPATCQFLLITWTSLAGLAAELPVVPSQ
jgi:hypothetical protein